MTPCETCRSQLLDHLYGLLDAEEKQALLAHLEGCAACQKALDQARAGQQKLAQAAKVSFPSVRFEAPVEPRATVQMPPSAVLPAGRRWNWRRVAVAAGVLLAVGAAGFGAYRVGEEYFDLRE